MTAKVLLDVAVILAVAQTMGAIFARFQQPPVIGQIVGGILLGPTLLGLVPGNPSADLFPPGAVAQLRVIGQLGLSAFMFTVGWDLDSTRLRRKAGAASMISIASVALPFALGLAVATDLYPQHRGADPSVSYGLFAVFVGTSLSITAFPVLARILDEAGIADSALGTTVLVAAALDDVLGWSALAIILALLASGGAWDYTRVLLETLFFGVALIVLVGPVLRRVAVRPGVTSVGPEVSLPFILAGVLACSYATEAIGVHAVFGAFLLGLVMPRWREAESLAAWRNALRPVIAFLLPVYFVVSGLAVDLTNLTSQDLGEFALILAAATVGKFGGAFAAARIGHLQPRDAAAVGVLMNTRGLIEIVLLTIGLEKGIIDRRLFSLLVLMALTTTIIAPPLLRALRPELGFGRRERARAKLNV